MCTDLTFKLKDIDFLSEFKNKIQLFAKGNSPHWQSQTQTQSERMEKRVQANGIQKQAGVAILISDKADFKPKLVKRDEGGHYILIKGIIHQEEMTVINRHEPNVGDPTFKKQTLMDIKEQIDSESTIADDFQYCTLVNR
jgi:hypothetical protein